MRKSVLILGAVALVMAGGTVFFVNNVLQSGKKTTQVVKKGLNVRQTEGLVRRMQKGSGGKPAAQDERIDPNIRALENEAPQQREQNLGEKAGNWLYNKAAAIFGG